MGCDPVAVDATCCRIMMLNPERVPYLLLGQGKKLGLLHEPQIEQIGAKITDIAQPFATVPHLRELCVGRSA